jgi:hypothetical protein
MSARDDFPRVTGITNEDQWLDMCDEIDTLRAWKEEATQVIDKWERCFAAVEKKGYLGRLGEFKSDHVLHWIVGWHTPAPEEILLTGRLSERDPSEQSVPKPEGPSTYSQMDFGREDIIGFAIDDKWHPTPGGL